MASRAAAIVRTVCFVALLIAARSEPPAVVRAAQLEPDEPIRSLLIAGAYDSAEVLAERGVSAAMATFGPSAIETAHALDVFVHTLALNGKGGSTRTLELANEALEIKRRASHLSVDELATSLTNVGDILIEQAKYPQAVEALRQALELHEPGDASGEVVTTLDSLGRAYNLANRHAESVATLERSLRLKQAISTVSSVEIARTLRGLGYALQRKGEYTQARPFLLRAIAIEEPLFAAHPDFVETLLMWSRQLWFEGDLQGSRDVAFRAVSAAESSLRPGHPTIAATLDNLGIAVAELGDLSAARGYMTRAVEIAQQAFPANSRQVAGYLNDLAVTTLQLGDYVGARTLFARAREIYESTVGRENPLVAQALINIAEVNEALGDYATSKADYRKALAIALSRLAGVSLREGQPAAALALFERALTIRTAALGANHRDVARTLEDMATALLQMGQVERAEGLVVRALRTWDAIDAPMAPDLADIHAIRGTLELRRGNASVGRESFDHALDIRIKVFGRGHPLFAEAQAGLAASLAQLGEYSAALQQASEADATGREHLRMVLRSLPERESLKYAARRPKSLDVAFSLIGREPDAISVAADGLIRSRALVLDEMARRRSSLRTGRAEVDAAWLRVAAAEQRLTNLVVRGPESRAINYVQLVEDARHDRELAVRALADQSTTFARERTQTDVGLGEVRSALPPGAALVSFVRYEQLPLPLLTATAPAPAQAVGPSYLALIMKRGEPIASSVLGPASAIDAVVARWRAANQTGTVDAETRAVGTRLRRLIWDPLAPFIGDVTRIFVVTDGSLSLVAFDGLPVGKTQYLAEVAPIITYVTAERDLAAPIAKGAVSGRGMLAIGGPAFDDRTVFNAGRAVRPESPNQRMARATATPFRAGCGNLQTMTFAPLQGSLLEVRDVQRIWTALDSRDNSAQLLVGRAATEHALKVGAPGHRVVHLATHGFFFGDDCQPTLGAYRAVGGLATSQNARRANVPHPLDDDPLLMTGLALAGANQRSVAGSEEDDGILTGEEVSAMNLDGVEWVVLSACDTGLGQVTRDEGIVGLRRAFQVAGARNVIMSLWPIDDLKTRSWMRRLYTEHFENGRDTAEAVRLANLATLRARRSQGLSTNPFFWAAFVSTGDWN